MKKFIYLFSTLLFCSFVYLNAQTKDSVKSKLKSLKGEAQKITIQTDKGEVILEGDEADYLFRKMKKETHSNSFSFISPGEDFLAGEDFRINIPPFPKIKVFKDWDHNLDLIDNFTRKITIEKEDGKTRVTVKRNEDGDEITETYEGEEAEKFLKELNEDEPVSIDTDSPDDKDTRIIIIR